MDVSSYVLLSQEQALRRRLDVIANNMANMNTTGFRREMPVFQEYVENNSTPPAPGMQSTSYVLDYGSTHDMSPGAYQATGNPLDVMIEGQGYLTVEGPDGNPAYTRAGMLRVSSKGELETSAGMRLLGSTGKPIAIPAEQAGQIRIAQDGAVTGPQGELGRLSLATFADESKLLPIGNSIFSAGGMTATAAPVVKLHAGGVEASNVQPLVETTQMIEVLRSYQRSQRALEGIRDLRSKAIDKLGQIG